MIKKEQITQIMEAVRHLDSGERAALRRAAGTSIRDADRRALIAFYRCLPYEVSEWDEPAAFAAVCMESLSSEGDTEPQPLPDILRVLAARNDISDSMSSRVGFLLELPWSEEDTRLLSTLHRLVRMAHQKGLRTDCEQLMQDIQNWNRDDQRVQRKWARRIFAAEKENENDAL